MRPVTLVLIVLLMVPAAAQAHKLLVEHQLLPGGKVRIASRFETGDLPTESEVEVRRAGGELLCEGTLDEKGVYVFRVRAAESLHVIVSDGTGHRAEFRISAKEVAATLGKDAASQAGACLFAPQSPLMSLTAAAAVLAPEETTTELAPFPAGSDGPPIGGVLLGVGLLLGLAAGFYALQWLRTGTPRT